jgi:predicted phosphate transport protein (TIGR00153 family)
MNLNLFSRLMPHEEAFTPLFCEQTQCIVEGARELVALVDSDDARNIDARVSAIRAVEVKADAVARRVFLAANRVFNAPIDREDIIALANHLDDAVDMIEDTAKAIQRYDLRTFPAQMRAIAQTVGRAADALHQVMPLLDAITDRHREILALCEKVGQIEEEADQAFDAGLTLLRADLRTGKVDTIGYLDCKEVYELLENTVDRCDDVANAVQAITAKHV